MNCQYVLTPTPELYNGIGGELTVKDLNSDYLGILMRKDSPLAQKDFRKDIYMPLQKPAFVLYGKNIKFFQVHLRLLSLQGLTVHNGYALAIAFCISST